MRSPLNLMACPHLVRTEGIIVWSEVLHVHASLLIGLPFLICLAFLFTNFVVIVVFMHFAPLIAQAFLFGLSNMHQVQLVILKSASVYSILIFILLAILSSAPNLSWVELWTLHALSQILSFTRKMLLGEALILVVKPVLLCNRLKTIIFFLLFTVGDIFEVRRFAVFCAHNLTFDLAKELVNARCLTLLVS